MIQYLFLASVVLCNLRFADEDKMETHAHVGDGPNITVHLIPHSHDDVGWLKTVDEYFYGGAQGIQFGAVQYTIDTVVEELWVHPEYKFVIVEMAFLYRWWNNANDDQKLKMKQLVQRNQLYFINGGWCMSDEATPYYQDFIDQMTIGLGWLKQTFNYVPDIAWHIDPFGHQASSATLFSQMGFQAFFFARIDFQDKVKRLEEKSLQMIWRPSQKVQDPSNYIFTHVNYNTYHAPKGFCFDNKCHDEPIKDDPTLEDYNINQRAQDFVQYFKSMAPHYRTTNIMHTLGGDFQYSNARLYFKNTDKLIKYINARPQFGVKIIYSTPNDYIKAIRDEDTQYPTKNDDFFPYADDEHSYWTGFYTSRTAFKGFVRDFGRWLQAVRKHISQLKIQNASLVILANKQELEQGLWEMEMAMGILQHHDAVSGTQKQRVANDYISTATKAINKFQTLYRKIIKEQILNEVDQTVSEQQIYFNLHWNETAKQTGAYQALKKNETVLIGLYNPGRSQTKEIKIAVPEVELRVVDDKNQRIEGDVFCANLNDESDCELVVFVEFGESSNRYLKITPMKSSSATAKVQKLRQITTIQSSKTFTLSSSASIKVTRASRKFDLTLNDKTQSFMVSYNYYEGYQGDGQNSGAYIFRPKINTAKKYSQIKRVLYADGALNVVVVLEGDKTQTKLVFSKMANYINERGFLVETFVDSIDVKDQIGKEITMNIATNLNNNNTFYTDSLGLEEQQRVLNFRPTWPLNLSEQVAGNYYPITSSIGLKDISTQQRLTVLSDRSVGGSVLRNGQIELMLHRRLLMDDSRGVDEPLNELDTDGEGLRQRVRHYVVFGERWRDVQVQNDQKVAITITQSNSAPFPISKIRKCPISVPTGVKLYLRSFIDDSYLVRVQNFNQEEATVSIPSGWLLTEMTLSANQLKQDWKAKQFKWKEEGLGKGERVEDLWEREGAASTIKLNFLEIKTFKMIRS